MIYPIDHYENKLDLIETEKAIKFIKDEFESSLAAKLRLIRVSAPLFVKGSSGLNDDLNGVERKVHFDVSFLEEDLEIVQSLAKWKRFALKKYDFPYPYGLYTDMNAIRKDEETDNLHSLYVDQWDWEKIIKKEKRDLKHLFSVVEDIYDTLKALEKKVNALYPVFKNKLPEKITFISTSELEIRYPDYSRKERERAYAKEVGAYFLYQIGWPLKDGKPHDGRAPDYDDWNLNGDIIFYNEVLDSAFEISSMGIRVDEESLIKQCEAKGEEKKLSSIYSKGILNKEYPYTIGGGIGQSRLCMYFLEKAHIGEVQSSIWEDKDILELEKQGIHLL
ncbi:MAG: aspartate--ammonia ligase [Bacilli bacterium]|nr:aspartate--ammonia ligase [Bacilli bacterium]